MRITVNFGLSNTLSRDFPSGTTVKDILNNPNLKAALGYGDNVSAKIDGVTQDPSRQLVDGDELDLEVRANTKAMPVTLTRTKALLLAALRVWELKHERL